MVYIIDDEEPIRDSLAWLLKSRGHASRAFASAREFADFMLAVEPADRTPGCLILDIRMPDMSGIELFDQMRTAGLHEIWPVIFLTGHGDVPMAVSALKKGAVDFIEKPFSDKDMLRLIAQCLELDRAAREQNRLGAETARRLAALTEREIEVMNLIIAGKLNKQVADILSISIKTVEVHRARIMDKMKVRSLAGLVQAVMRVRQ